MNKVHAMKKVLQVFLQFNVCAREKELKEGWERAKKYRERERESQTGLLTLLTNWFVRNSVDETEICLQMFHLLFLFRYRQLLTSLIKQSFIRDS